MIAGLPRFPCSSNKRPLSLHGHLDATSNPINEDRWSLTGVPTGMASDLYVLDMARSVGLLVRGWLGRSGR